MNGQEFKKLFGLQVKKYRIKNKLSQEELAEVIEKSQRQISLIELGKSFPSPDTITSLVSALNCDLSELFGFSNYKKDDVMRKELKNLIETCSEDKIKILYTISQCL